MTIGVCALAFGAFAAAQNAEWKAAMDRGESADHAGKYVEAVADYSKAAAVADGFGTNDFRTWTSYNRLGIAYQNAGMSAEGIRCYRREISMIAHSIGKQNTAYPIAIANLGTALVSTGDFSGGEALLREAMQLETGVIHADPSQIALTQARFIEALMGRGHFAEADRLLDRALPALRATGDRFYLAVALNALGVLRRHQHRNREALDAFQQAVALTEAEYREDHPILVFPLNNLGVTYSLLGNAAEADRAFRRALDICAKALPPGHPSHAAVLANYAEFLRRSGEKSKAKAMRQEADTLLRDNARRNGRGLTIDVTAFRQD